MLVHGWYSCGPDSRPGRCLCSLTCGLAHLILSCCILLIKPPKKLLFIQKNPSSYFYYRSLETVSLPVEQQEAECPRRERTMPLAKLVDGQQRADASWRKH